MIWVETNDAVASLYVPPILNFRRAFIVHIKPCFWHNMLSIQKCFVELLFLCPVLRENKYESLNSNWYEITWDIEIEKLKKLNMFSGFQQHPSVPVRTLIRLCIVRLYRKYSSDTYYIEFITEIRENNEKVFSKARFSLYISKAPFALYIEALYLFLMIC